MDPKHRDRLAFVKIVSGTFKRNSPYLHVRNGKKVKFENSKTKTFFRLQEINGRWWFITPDGEKFWSLGINHFDSATLRYEESGNIWEVKYENSMKKWLKQVKKDVVY